MNRLIKLVLFELKKILAHKKAILFVIALNIVPILASITLIFAYIKINGFGMGGISQKGLYEGVKFFFHAHYKLFALASPFFLSLIVGDSFCTEFNKGYMKMLLLTPTKRENIIFAKSVAIIGFLIIAISLGAILLQGDLIVAKFLPSSPQVPIPGLSKIGAQSEIPTSILTFSSAFQLLFMAFTANLMTTSFLVLVSMFFESAIIMSFTSIAIFMAIYCIYWISDIFLSKFYSWAEYLSGICFTRHLEVIYSNNSIDGICNGTLSAFSGEIWQNCLYAILWALIFFGISAFIFSRKHIMH